MILENTLFYAFRCLYLLKGFFLLFIFGQFCFQVHINSSHFVSPFLLHLLAPLLPHYTCWCNVAYYWDIALIADLAVHSSAIYPFLLGVIQSLAFAHSLHQEVNKKWGKPFKTHQHTPLLLQSVIWSILQACYLHYQWNDRNHAFLYIVDRRFQDDLYSLWTPTLLKGKTAKVAEEQ